MKITSAQQHARKGCVVSCHGGGGSLLVVNMRSLKKKLHVSFLRTELLHGGVYRVMALQRYQELCPDPGILSYTSLQNLDV